ncbi:hypothetical protein ABPG74_003815 [Tetrahymena malaccensis]
MIQIQPQEANKDQRKDSQVHLKIYINEQIQALNFPEFQKIVSQIKDKLIDLCFERLESQKQLFVSIKCESYRESSNYINKIIDFFKKNPQNQIIFDDVELEITIYRTNIINLQMLHKTFEKILHDVTKFKLFSESEINEKQLKQIILTLKELRQVESFQFFCKEKLMLKEQDLDTQFVDEIQRIVKNSKTLIFNNCLEKGYNSSEICTIPGLLSQSIIDAKKLLNLEINFHHAGWIKKNRAMIILSKFLDNFTSYLPGWPTQLEVIKIDFDRLICFNPNFNPQSIQKFLVEFANMLSKQNNLRELSLNLQGIGYQCGQMLYYNYTGLCKITESIKTVNVLKLLFGGKIELNEQDWTRFFKGISSINKLQDLELNIESWKFVVSNITDKQQYNIINNFLNDLILNHTDNLQRLSLNTDNWRFLYQVNIIDLLQRINKFKNLISLKLLNSKTDGEEQFSLINQAEQYYSTLYQYTQNMIKIQNVLKKSNILQVINDTLQKNFLKTIESVYKDLAKQQLFNEEKSFRTTQIKSTSNFIIRCIQSILDVQHYFCSDIQDNFYNVDIMLELISEISLSSKKHFPNIYQYQILDDEMDD